MRRGEVVARVSQASSCPPCRVGKLPRASDDLRRRVHHIYINSSKVFDAPIMRPSTVKMGMFPNRPTPGSSNIYWASLAARYRRLLHTRPFLSFGLPFVAAIVSGSFLLTPATAIRYEKFDRKTHSLDREEAMGLGFRNLGQPAKSEGQGEGGAEKKQEKKAGGKFLNKDIREEYWKLAGGDKIDDYEPKRVKRRPGELDGTFD